MANKADRTEKADKKRLIIVDDEPIIRMDLREMLTGLGYEVVAEAADGATAITLAKQLKPDLVIMDIKMPGLDGITAARIIAEERIAPVLLLTAYSQPELVEGAKGAGVIAYLVKPFRESDLGPAIEVAIERYQELQALEKEVADLKDALETRKLVDQAKGILMDTQGLTEAEAFRRIQRLSMNTRRPMKEIAQAIILAHQLGKEL